MEKQTQAYYACVYEAQPEVTGIAELITRSGWHFLAATRPRCVQGAWEAVLYRVIAECEKEGSYLLETTPDGQPRAYRAEWLDTYHKGFDPDHIYERVDWAEI